MFEIILMLIMSFVPGYLISFFDKKINDLERLAISVGISFFILAAESLLLHFMKLPMYFTLITFIPILLLIYLRKVRITFKIEKKIVYILVLAFIIRFVLQFFYLFPYNGDSYFHMVMARSFSTDSWFYSNAVDNLWKYTSHPFPEEYRPPFFNFMIGYFLNFYSDVLQIGKFVNVIIGTITVIPLFLIARKYSNERVAFLAVLLYAVSPVMISQSFETEVRMTTVYFALAALYFILKERMFNYYTTLFFGILFLTHYAPFETLFITTLIYLLIIDRKKLFSKFNILYLLLFVVIVSPWIIRNLVLYDSPFFSSGCISIVSDFNECFRLQRPTVSSYLSYLSQNPFQSLSARIINFIRSTFPVPLQGYKDGWIQNFDIFNNHALVYTPMSMIVTLPLFFLSVYYFFQLLKKRRLHIDPIFLYVAIGFVSATILWSYRTTYTYNFMFPQTVLMMIPGLTLLDKMSKKWKRIIATTIVLFLILQISVFALKNNSSRDFAQSWIVQNTDKDETIMVRWTNVHILNYYTGRKTIPIPYENEDIVIDFARDHGAKYLIIDQLDLDLGKINLESIKNKLSLVDTYKIPQPLYERTYVNTFYILKV